MTVSLAEATAAARRIQADFADPESAEPFEADAVLLAGFVLAGDTERPLADIRALRLGIARDVWPAEDSEAGIGRRRALEVLDGLLDELGVSVPPHGRDCYCDECEAYWARVPQETRPRTAVRAAVERLAEIEALDLTLGDTLEAMREVAAELRAALAEGGA